MTSVRFLKFGHGKGIPELEDDIHGSMACVDFQNSLFQPHLSNIWYRYLYHSNPHGLVFFSRLYKPKSEVEDRAEVE